MRLFGCWCGCRSSGCVWTVKLLTGLWLLAPASCYSSGLLRCFCCGSRALQPLCYFLQPSIKKQENSCPLLHPWPPRCSWLASVAEIERTGEWFPVVPLGIQRAQEQNSVCLWEVVSLTPVDATAKRAFWSHVVCTGFHLDITLNQWKLTDPVESKVALKCQKKAGLWSSYWCVMVLVGRLRGFSSLWRKILNSDKVLHCQCVVSEPQC